MASPIVVVCTPCVGRVEGGGRGGGGERGGGGGGGKEQGDFQLKVY